MTTDQLYPWEPGAFPDAGEDEMVILLGRQSPVLHAKIPVWLMLARPSARAIQVYAIYRMHVNGLRGDLMAWPKRKAVAELAGFDKISSVDRYNRELVTLKAIELRARYGPNGAQIANAVIVHETPPPGYTGPVSLTDYYRPPTP